MAATVNIQVQVEDDEIVITKSGRQKAGGTLASSSAHRNKS
jgi:hypothetical protein